MSISIASEIQALQRMTVAQLRVRWSELYGEETRSRNRTFLWRRLAWRVQELEYGGLSDAAKARIAEFNQDNPYVRRQVPRGFAASLEAKTAPRRDPRLPSAGSTLVRRYKGQDIRVTVLDDGFEWDGRRFDSLSEVAFAVTGSKWNGWLFFGLTGRKRAR
jgi:Protein of unknown function (DUF2924)